MQLIIFTDLDGTLLDYEGYSYIKSQDSLKLINNNKFPLIILSSKTRNEIEFYRKKLGNNDPFVSENGGAIFIPKNYFDFSFEYDKQDENYFIIQLGMGYDKILESIKEFKKKIKCFSDMSIEELSKDTGLPLNEAEMAKQREFIEPFRILEHEKELLAEIGKLNLKVTKGGLYWHIMGKGNDKGKAVTILIELFRKKYGEIKTMGIGDSENDFEMLDNVDKAYLVMRQDGTYASEKYLKAEGIGPEGWNKAIRKEIEN